MCAHRSLCGARKSAGVAWIRSARRLMTATLARIYTVKKGDRHSRGGALSYHPNGNLAVEAPYKNGKLDGVFKSYYESGKVWQTIGYREGIEEGFQH